MVAGFVGQSAYSRVNWQPWQEERGQAPTLTPYAQPAVGEATARSERLGGNPGRQARGQNDETRPPPHHSSAPRRGRLFAGLIGPDTPPSGAQRRRPA